MSNHSIPPDQDCQPPPEETLVLDTIKSDRKLWAEQSLVEYVETPEVEPDVRSMVLCQAGALSSYSLESFSAWLQIPKSCLYLERIYSTLERHLDNVKAIAQIEEDSLPDFVIDGLTALNKTLAANRSDWSLRNCWLQSGREQDPTYRIQTESPFYAALPYPANVEDETAQHSQLTAHLVFAALQAWDNEQKQYRHGMSGVLNDAAKALRKLSIATCISLLPSAPCSISTFRAAINLAIESKGAPETAISEKDIKHLKAILDLLTAIDGDDDEEITDELEWKSLSPDFIDSDSFIHYSTNITASKTELREIKKSGLAIDEIRADVEYVIWEPNTTSVPPDHPPKTPPSLDQQVLRRKHQITSMERGAQILPIMWNRLRPHEIAAVVESFVSLATDISPNGVRQWKDDVTAIEASVVALTSFWTSRSVDESASLILMGSKNHLPKSGRLSGIAYILATDEWAIPVVGPKQAPKYLGTDYALTESVSPIFLVPAPASFSVFIRQLVSHQRHDDQPDEIRFAVSGPKNILFDRIRACLANLKKISAGRITPERIAELLFYQIYNETRDLASAAVTTGHRHRFADTALHYANINIEQRRADYQRACKKIEAICFEEIKLRRGKATNDPDKIKQTPILQNSDGVLPIPEYLNFGRVGTPICPKLDTVTRLQKAIRGASSQLLEQPCNHGFLVKHHNLLVLYTVLMIKSGTGYRDIRSPIPRRSDINLEDNTILISDKDDASAFNTRVLPLVSPLREQWLEIDLHVRALASRLAMSSPNLAAKLYRLHNLAPSPPKPKNERERKQQLKDKPVPPLFFLDNSSNELSVVDIRPKSLAAEIELYAPWFALPTNANRSRLRTYLLDHDCPADVVDYLMGHWVRGQEPLGRFATLPLSRYLELLRTHLESALHEEGWIALKGFS